MSIETGVFASEIGPGFSPDIAEAIATGFSPRDSFSYGMSTQFKEAIS